MKKLFKHNSTAEMWVTLTGAYLVYLAVLVIYFVGIRLFGG